MLTMVRLFLKKPPKKILLSPQLKKIGHYSTNITYLQKHIDAILNYPLVEVEKIRKKITE
jgi:phosphomannomutase